MTVVNIQTLIDAVVRGASSDMRRPPYASQRWSQAC